jgi:hypothetical protein
MMDEERKQILVEAVRKSADIPPDVRGCAENAQSVQEHSFDQSYLEFLDEQIRLCPRGPEWNERLLKRRRELARYCDRVLIRGRITIRADDYAVEVDPNTGEVVHLEAYIGIWKANNGADPIR